MSLWSGREVPRWAINSQAPVNALVNRASPETALTPGSLNPDHGKARLGDYLALI